METRAPTPAMATAAKEPPRVVGAGRTFLFVSSWRAAATSGGLHVFEVDEESGRLTHRSSCCPALSVEALAIAPRRQVLYALDQTTSQGGVPGARLCAFSIDPADGSLTLLQRVPTCGNTPNGIAIDPTESFLAVDNYGSDDPPILQTSRAADGSITVREIFDESSVVVFPLGEDGRLGSPTDLVVHRGRSGAHPVLQRTAHVHSVAFDPSGEFLLACDRGADSITCYALDRRTGALSLRQALRTPPGTGPRNLAFAGPTLAVVSSELQSLATSYRFDPGTGELAALDTASTLSPHWRPRAPDDGSYQARPQPSQLAASQDGAHAFVLNRGPDDVATLRLDAGSGRLSYAGAASSGGANPRAIEVHPGGRLIFVANHGAGSVVALQHDQASGALTPTGAVAHVELPAALKVFTSTRSEPPDERARR